MSAATQNEMERLRQERDAIQQQLDAALEREAALAAHVERLLGCLVIDDDGADIKKVSELKEVISQSPATSLANLKAEWDQDELQPIWETLIKVADMLGIDPEKARRAGGKPSETYAAHLARRDLIKQAEALEDARGFIIYELLHSSQAVIYMQRRADDLRQRAASL